MNSDWNVAEREQQVNGPDATDYQCYRTGQIHRAYGWAKIPSGAWNDAQVALYNRGFDGKPMEG